MSEHALAWYPVPDIDDGFGSIWFARDTGGQGGSRRVSITMRGKRNLSLKFTGVIALHFEDECPGYFPLPVERPRLNAAWMFPLLKIEDSNWLAQWPMWPNLVHYALLSSDDLVQLIAEPTVSAQWEGSSET